MGPVTAATPRPRRKTSAAVVLSIIVHGVLLYVLARVTILTPRRPDRLAEAPTTTLTLPISPPPAQPAPPEPDPAEPAPAAPAPAPEPPPAVVEPRRPTPLLITATPQRFPDAVEVAPRPQPKATPPKPAPTPPPEPPREEPRVSFAGLDASPASRIVYVVDGSAAMIPTLPFVRDELARSVARLGPTQLFQVVVFRRPPIVDDRPTAPELETFAPAGTFVAATPATKVRLTSWIGDIRPAGGSAPVVGLRAAMGQGPDLVFLMTCSIKRTGGEWGDGRDAILAELDRLNPVNAWTRQRPAVIKAVQFLDDDPTGILAAIAQTHGDGPGSYRVLRLKELSPAR